MFKEASFFFGCFFVHTYIDKSMLEETMPFMYFFNHSTVGICQIQKIIFYGDKSAPFQERFGNID